MSSGVLLDVDFFLFYRFFDQKDYTILDIESRQNCLFVFFNPDISGSGKIALYVNVGGWAVCITTLDSGFGSFTPCSLTRTHIWLHYAPEDVMRDDR